MRGTKEELEELEECQQEWSRCATAMHWLKPWRDAICDNPYIPHSNATMHGWFANAIMAGYDEAKRLDAIELAALRTALARKDEALGEIADFAGQFALAADMCEEWQFKQLKDIATRALGEKE